ncbi:MULTISPECIES: hypothetical protein [unclassified Pseudofrankia]|uniref:hypothetical protein n=1 Tax=unclassified Pseudofrankia TaxID=2994372 RepID=UPI0008DAE260|nr:MULTISPECIES: hypothetical protein [unclassified Pseudofrankia]MDT3442373.1 hypothetical protein [Pseudofrankia sp. BMG5.37]OHV47871.1 hypothetical protein BCD48_17125 [Pseudofrankia sp. BMG5.36]
MRWWKVLGLAGVVGVATTGAMVARKERARRAYTPDEVRERLHGRLAESTAAPSPNGSSASTRAAGHRRAHPDAS